LNKLYKKQSALHELQFDAAGFEWISHEDADNSVISYVRIGNDSKVIVVCNMTPVPRENYRVGLPEIGKYKLLFNSDDSKYGGSDYKIKKSFTAQKENWQYRDQSVELNLPPLGVLVYGF